AGLLYPAVVGGVVDVRVGRTERAGLLVGMVDAVRPERIAADQRGRAGGREAVRRAIEVRAADEDEVRVVGLDVEDLVVPGLGEDVRRQVGRSVLPRAPRPAPVAG